MKSVICVFWVSALIVGSSGLSGLFGELFPTVGGTADAHGDGDIHQHGHADGQGNIGGHAHAHGNGHVHGGVDVDISALTDLAGMVEGAISKGLSLLATIPKDLTSGGGEALKLFTQALTAIVDIAKDTTFFTVREFMKQADFLEKQLKVAIRYGIKLADDLIGSGNIIIGEPIRLFTGVLKTILQMVGSIKVEFSANAAGGGGGHVRGHGGLSGGRRLTTAHHGNEGLYN